MGLAMALDTEERNTDIALLLEAIYAHRGYDFRGYSRASITRRINNFMAKHRVQNTAEITARIRHDHAFFNLLVSELSVTVTEMFRRPSVFRLLREKALPALADKPALKVWTAGCATGEETYSLAILLHEAGLLERTQVYATDINPVTLETAAKAMIPLSKLKAYTANYHQSGGQEDFCDYYAVRHNFAFMENFLKDRILFTTHNLVHDQVFGEMDMIFCRNVLIYFTPELQRRVVGLFLDSLTKDGFLCLGSKENLYLSNHEHHFDFIQDGEKLYRRRHSQKGKFYVAG